MARKPLPRQSVLLPTDAREWLVAASKLPDPRQRKAAVQAAIERAQRKYPHHFNQEGVTP